MATTHRKLARARDFIQQSYVEPISLADIAEKANLSPYHFLRSDATSCWPTRNEYDKTPVGKRNFSLKKVEV